MNDLMHRFDLETEDDTLDLFAEVPEQSQLSDCASTSSASGCSTSAPADTIGSITGAE